MDADRLEVGESVLAKDARQLPNLLLTVGGRDEVGSVNTFRDR